MARRRHQNPKLQKTKTKDKRNQQWFFLARIDVLDDEGKQKREEKRFYLGSTTQMNQKQALQARDLELTQKINKPEVILSSQVLFGAVLDRWLNTVPVQAPTHGSYASLANVHLRPQWGGMRLCDITPMAVEAWLVAKAKTTRQSMLKNIQRRFATVWNRAIFWRFTKDACPLIGMPTIVYRGKPKRVKTLPTITQFNEFLYLLEEPYRSIILVCTFCGLRISETLALTVAQLNSEIMRIELAAKQRTGELGPVKTERSNRDIPMRRARGLIQIPVDAQPDDRPFHVLYKRVYVAIKEAAQVIGIDYEGFGCHTFRRMHNTMFRDLAGNTPESTKMAMEQLGHGDARTNDIYYVEGAEGTAKRARVVDRMVSVVMEETVQ